MLVILLLFVATHVMSHEMAGTFIKFCAGKMPKARHVWADFYKDTGIIIIVHRGAPIVCVCVHDYYLV